jgi:hypothetical protein
MKLPLPADSRYRCKLLLRMLPPTDKSKLTQSLTKSCFALINASALNSVVAVLGTESCCHYRYDKQFLLAQCLYAHH